jgi:hypothetical protein
MLQLLTRNLKEFLCLFDIERPVTFVNAGGGAIKKEGNINLDIEKDCSFEGGDVLRTDESIINGGDRPSVYQSTRSVFSYKLNADSSVKQEFLACNNSNAEVKISSDQVRCNLY